MTIIAGRLENTEGTHNKFWEYQFDTDDGLFVRRWGKIGASNFQQKEQSAFSLAALVDIVDEKLSNGYRLVVGQHPSKPLDPRPPKPIAPKHSDAIKYEPPTLETMRNRYAPDGYTLVQSSGYVEMDKRSYQFYVEPMAIPDKVKRADIEAEGGFVGTYEEAFAMAEKLNHPPVLDESFAPASGWRGHYPGEWGETRIRDHRIAIG